MSWLLVRVSWAHLSGGVYPSHQLELEIQGDGVRAVYSARIPTHEVVEELEALRQAGDPLAADAQAFSDRKMDELRDNLALRLDGEQAVWQRREDDAKGNSKYLYYDQVLWLGLSEGPHEVQISNGNVPDQVCYFMVTARLDPAWVIEETSLLFFDEGELKRNRDGRWRMDEDARELTMSLRPATWLESLEREDGRQLTVVEALPPRRSTGSLVVVGLVALALGGLGLGLRSRH